MGHVMIAVALLAVFGLDMVFIHFSGTAIAGLTFAVLGFAILALLSATAGSFVPQEDQGSLLDLRPVVGGLGSGPAAMAARVMLGACIPVLLILAVVYIPELDRSLVPSQGIRLGTTAATLGLLAALPLAGVALGFLWPRTGALEAVLVGGVVIADYAMLSWGTLGIGGAELELALYDLMVWPLLALIGAWVGLSLRQLSESRFYQALAGQRAPVSASASQTAPAQVAAGQFLSSQTLRTPASDVRATRAGAPFPAADPHWETPTSECQTFYPGRAGFSGI